MGSPESILSEILDAFQKSGRLTDSDVSSGEYDGIGYTGGVRYWGDWEVPEDEEDDGDYDWEVPTKRTQEAAIKVISKFKEKYPSVDISLGVGEKNWIYITVKGRTNMTDMKAIKESVDRILEGGAESSSANAIRKAIDSSGVSDEEILKGIKQLASKEAMVNEDMEWMSKLFLTYFIVGALTIASGYGGVIALGEFGYIEEKDVSDITSAIVNSTGLFSTAAVGGLAHGVLAAFNKTRDLVTAIDQTVHKVYDKAGLIPKIQKAAAKEAKKQGVLKKKPSKVSEDRHIRMLGPERKHFMECIANIASAAKELDFATAHLEDNGEGLSSYTVDHIMYELYEANRKMSDLTSWAIALERWCEESEHAIEQELNPSDY